MWNFQAPIGLQLSQTARVVSRAFDEALDKAGGSLPVWLILLNLTIRQTPHQRALAEAVGVTGATLTHHLNAMEKRGLITRRRDPENRRVHVVEVTEEGRQVFTRLRQAAMEFTARLNAGLSAEETDALSQLLARLAANVGAPTEGTPPWAGLAEGK
ncbi:MarR family winged helix-turn-helix transcriptional regulator [Streptomyces sp. NPDC004752]